MKILYRPRKRRVGRVALNIAEVLVEDHRVLRRKRCPLPMITFAVFVVIPQYAHTRQHIGKRPSLTSTVFTQDLKRYFSKGKQQKGVHFLGKQLW